MKHCKVTFIQYRNVYWILYMTFKRIKAAIIDPRLFTIAMNGCTTFVFMCRIGNRIECTLHAFNMFSGICKIMATEPAAAAAAQACSANDIPFALVVLCVC